MCKKICEQCGGEFKVKPSRAETARFCSRECTDKWQSSKNNPRWKGGNIVKICEHCGGEYEAEPRKQDKRRFCSEECAGKWKSGSKIVKTCEQCGREFEVYPSRKDERRFCSRDCYAKWRKVNWCGKNSPAWKNGVSFEPYCPKFNNAFKESVREKHCRVCFLCPTTEEENGKKLCVHHIDYNKDCLCDDSECEFVPLCNKCHTKTNFNRDYWENLIMEKLNETYKIL